MQNASNHTASNVPTGRGTVTDSDYSEFLLRLQVGFAARSANGTRPLFTTSASDLFEAYLGAMPPEQRQHHTCNACKQFIQRYGSLAVINEDGSLSSAYWDADAAPEFYRPAVAELARLVSRAKVTGVFRTQETTWGLPKTGEWQHFHAIPAATALTQHPKRAAKSAYEWSAGKLENFKDVMRGLDEYSVDVLNSVLSVMESGSVQGSEKFVAPVKWLRDLHLTRQAAKGLRGTHLLWLAIATAPEGFCHPRSAVWATLADDLRSGMNLEKAKGIFNKKMHPLMYQRPQAAPSQGTIAQAEKVVEQMGLAPALPRRIALADEVQCVWRPIPDSAPASASGGVFGHLQPKGVDTPVSVIPAQTVTWVKFRDTVMSQVKSMTLRVPGHANFRYYTAAVNPEAPPLMKWDYEGLRNPFSSYVWHGGNSAADIGLRAGAWVPVVGVSLAPEQWNDRPSERTEVVFLLEGASERRSAGLALFPENLRGELHGVRSVIEAYSRRGTMQGIGGAGHAIGLPVTAKFALEGPVRVTLMDGRKIDYTIDRWD
jgi:hypothetical protein